MNELHGLFGTIVRVANKLEAMAHGAIVLARRVSIYGQGSFLWLLIIGF
jgi:hypothetical protein